jgi:MPBQ/MSBQ methyltransferase
MPGSRATRCAARANEGAWIMPEIESEIRSHYARPALARAIEEGLAALGLADRPAGIDDLAPIDEFHMGGRPATEALAGRLGVAPGTTVLDIGSGIGGPARFIAARHGCRVTGIDLTPEYVAVAEELTRRVGLLGRVRFQVASALDLPFAPASFQAATLVHVGMNIADKDRLFAEAARVLVPGGTFAVYEVMRLGDRDPDYPAPWATTPATSFLAAPADYRRGLGAAGFWVEEEVTQTALALELFARLRARIREQGPPPLGLHLLMGADAPIKLANMTAALEDGRIAPVLMVCRRA